MEFILFLDFFTNQSIDGYKGYIMSAPDKDDEIIVNSGSYTVAKRRFNFKTKTLTIWLIKR